MDPSPNALLPEIKPARKAMVDHRKASEQTLPSLSGGSFSGTFWTETLGRLGLESPGYQETLKIMRDKRAEKEKEDGNV